MPMFDFEILKNVNNGDWNSKLLNCEYSTFFQTLAYLKTNNPNKYPIFIYVYDDKKNILGQLGIMITISQEGYSNRSLKKITKIASKLSKRGTWVNGPIIHSNDKKLRLMVLETFMEAIKVVVEENNLSVIDGYSPPQDKLVDEDYKEIFKNNGFKSHDYITYVTDLSRNLEDIWKKVKKNTRNDVTKAKREGISVKHAASREDLQKYWGLAKTWAKTKGIEITDTPLQIEKDWEDLQSGTQKIFMALQDKELIAGLRIVVFNGICYTHQVLNSYAKKGNVGGPLLTWSAIEWSKSSGMRLYDFSGGEEFPSNKKEEKRFKEHWKSLLEYKKKWSGDRYPYFHFIKIPKETRHKIFRAVSHPDWIVREYKKRHFKKPGKLPS